MAEVQNLTTQTALSVWGLTGDFVAVLAILVALFLFAWYVGRGPFVSLLLSLYGAFAVYSLFPYMAYLPSTPALTAFLAAGALYATLALAFYIVLRRFIVSEFLYIGVLSLLALSLLGAGFILAIAYHSFGLAAVLHLPTAVSGLFAAKQYFFWWFIAPLVGLFFLAR